MYERSYGYKYHEHTCGNDACDHADHLKRPAWESAAEIAKRIRADIKQAVCEGLLPSEASYSVTSESYSGGQSIDVTVKRWPQAWQTCRRDLCRNPWCVSGGEHKDLPGAAEHEILTEEAEAARMTLERIHGAYNYDGSDVMTDYFDVRYYGGVKFEDARSAAFWAEDRAKKQARRAAIDEAAGQSTRRIAVYKRDGSRTVHLAAEVDGKIMLVCGARTMGYSLTKTTDAAVTCSRCAKRAHA